jgi:hypothetical protein
MKIKGFRFTMPRWTVGALPGLMRFPIPGVPPQMRLVVGASVSTAGLTLLLGFFLATMVGTDKTPQWPDLGAVYTVKADPIEGTALPSRVGQRLPPDKPGEISQTVELNLEGGSRVHDITFRDLSLGKTGLIDSVQINATSTAWLVCDEVIIRDSEFPTMDLANAEFYTITATTTVLVAGHSVTPTYSTTIADITVGAAREAGDWISGEKNPDRIIITTSGVSDVACHILLFDNVRASVGGFNLDYVKAGTLTLVNVRIGDDGDIDTASFVMNSSVKYTFFNDGIVDRPIRIQ